MDRFIDASCCLPKASASCSVDFGMILLLFGLFEFKCRSIKIWINIWISFRYTLDKADGQIYRRVMPPTKSLSILIYRLWHDVTRQRAFQYAIWMVIYCPACLAMKGLSHFFSEGQGFQDTVSSIFFDNITYKRRVLVFIDFFLYVFSIFFFLTEVQS